MTASPLPMEPMEPEDLPFWSGRGPGDRLGEEMATDGDSETGEYPIRTSAVCISLAHDEVTRGNASPDRRKQ